MRSFHALALIGAFLTLGSTTALAHQTEQLRYRLVKVEDANSGMETAPPGALNNRGWITGQAIVEDFPFRAVYLWRNGRLERLQGDGELTPFDGLGMNDRGQIVGHALLAGTTPQNQLRGFVWTHGKLTHIGDLSGGIEWSIAYDINNRRQVVGASESAEGHEAVLWEDGNLMSLGDLPGSVVDSTAVAINEWGVVVGQGRTDAGIRPFIWRNGTMRELPVPEGTDTAVTQDINNFNVVVGAGVVNSNPVALLWSPRGAVKVLPRLPGFDWANARGVNDFGDAVGSSVRTDGEGAATLWHHDATYNLNDLIADSDPLKACTTLASAVRINNVGEIAATGVNSCGDGNHVYLLKPVRKRHG